MRFFFNYSYWFFKVKFPRKFRHGNRWLTTQGSPKCVWDRSWMLIRQCRCSAAKALRAKTKGVDFWKAFSLALHKKGRDFVCPSDGLVPFAIIAAISSVTPRPMLWELQEDRDLSLLYQRFRQWSQEFRRLCRMGGTSLLRSCSRFQKPWSKREFKPIAGNDTRVDNCGVLSPKCSRGAKGLLQRIYEGSPFGNLAARPR